MRPQTSETNGGWHAFPCREQHDPKGVIVRHCLEKRSLLGCGGMTFGTGRSNSSTGYDHRRLLPNALQQRALGGAMLVSVAALSAWTLCSTLADTSPDQINLAGTCGDKLACSLATFLSPYSTLALLCALQRAHLKTARLCKVTHRRRHSRQP